VKYLPGLTAILIETSEQAMSEQDGGVSAVICDGISAGGHISSIVFAGLVP
jgi:NAD(P)H-dependent flavin oxidoreductase YrpB (nitropropane dioxygenase family)